MIRTNPRFSNTCALQIGMNRADPCYDCWCLSHCDRHFDEKTGTWDYPIPKIPKSKDALLHEKIISDAVSKFIDKCGGVYTDDLIDETGLSRERIVKWLKDHGFQKPSGHTSRRWVMDWASNPLDHFLPPEEQDQTDAEPKIPA